MPGTRRFIRYVLFAFAFGLASAFAVLPASPRVPRAEAAECNKLAFPDTLQALIDGADPGDVICMAPGVYRGPVRFEDKHGVTLRGTGPRESIVAGGDKDSMLVFNSRDLTFEDFTLLLRPPVERLRLATARTSCSGGWTLAAAPSASTTTRAARPHRDSFVYAMDGDGVLIRRQSNVTVERNWVFDNGGVGVSTVGETATTDDHAATSSPTTRPGRVRRADAVRAAAAGLRRGAGVLPAQPARRSWARRTSSSNANVIQSSGSTGIVMFPGTRGTFTQQPHLAQRADRTLRLGRQRAPRRAMSTTGTKSTRSSSGRIPDPLKYGRSGDELHGAGRRDLNNTPTFTTPSCLPETGTLGGGVLAQGANMDVRNSRIHSNRGIGVSYVNTSLGAITSNTHRRQPRIRHLHLPRGQRRRPGNSAYRQRRRHRRRLPGDDAVAGADEDQARPPLHHRHARRAGRPRHVRSAAGSGGERRAGDPGVRRARARRWRSATTALEIVAPLDSDSAVMRFLERKGEGFYNLALEVDDLDAAVTELAARGVRVSEPVEPGPGLRSAFITMAATHGLSIQLLEVAPAAPTATVEEAPTAFAAPEPEPSREPVEVAPPAPTPGAAARASGRVVHGRRHAIGGGRPVGCSGHRIAPNARPHAG